MDSLIDGTPVRQRVLPETARATAKADLRKAEKVDYRARIAKEVIEPLLAGLALKEVSALIFRATGREIDERQIARWKTGEERPQFDALIAVEQFRHPLLLLWAQFIGGAVEVTTHIVVKRIA